MSLGALGRQFDPYKDGDARAWTSGGDRGGIDPVEARERLQESARFNVDIAKLKLSPS